MAWTTPKTWSAAATLTAAELNTHVRDNLTALGPDGATSASWTPVITGGTAGSTSAADEGREYRIGPLQFAWAYWLSPNTTGTAGGVEGSLNIVAPETPANIAVATNKGQVVGSWRWYDAAAPGSSLSGVCVLSNTNTIQFGMPDGNVAVHTSVAAGTGNTITVFLCYPVA